MLLGELHTGFEHTSYGFNQTDNGCDYGSNPADHSSPTRFRLFEEILLLFILLCLLAVQVLQLARDLAYRLRLCIPLFRTLLQAIKTCEVLAQLLVEFLHATLVVTHVSGVEAIRLLQRAYLCVQVINNLLLAQVFVRQHTALNLNLTQVVFLNGQLRCQTF